MTKIIAFSGKKQSGKTTSANFIYGLFLANAPLFQNVSITANGTIEVKKAGSDDYIDIDIVKYYFGIGHIDPDIASVIQTLNPHVRIYSFADILKKDICMNILGLTYEQCYGDDAQKNSLTDLTYEHTKITAREAMQIIGTDFFRSLKTNVWPECLMRRIAYDNPQMALITDCRFPNEVDAIKGSNGKIIRLTKKLPNITGEHVSERILDKDSYDWNNFDYVIDNAEMSIEQQCEELIQIMEKETAPS